MKYSISKIMLSMLVLSLGLFSSCRDQEVDSEEELETAPPTTPPGEGTGTDTSINDNPDNSTAEVNPAHGQPGHRCDIPVGAPLNQQASQSSGSNQMTESPVRLRSSAPKKNPPHGEPGHDCSVPVGADLGK